LPAPPQEGDVQAQINQVEDQLAKGVDAMALAPGDPNAFGPIVDDAIKSGVPVVFVDTNEYEKLFHRHEKIEELKREDQHKKIQNTKFVTNKRYDDEDKTKDEEHMNFDKVEKRINTVAGGSTGTIRNLRIREDTAKYLLNLDLDSAYYDPKSRSMREDPNPDRPIYDKCYSGDNNLKISGCEYQEFMKLQSYQFNSLEKSLTCIENLAPSQAEELIFKKKLQEDRLLHSKKVKIFSKYGNS
jgi:pre-mRNA-processing factor SLU7